MNFLKLREKLKRPLCRTGGSNSFKGSGPAGRGICRYSTLQGKPQFPLRASRPFANTGRALTARDFSFFWRP